MRCSGFTHATQPQPQPAASFTAPPRTPSPSPSRRAPRPPPLPVHPPTNRRNRPRKCTETAAVVRGGAGGRVVSQKTGPASGSSAGPAHAAPAEAPECLSHSNRQRQGRTNHGTQRKPRETATETATEPATEPNGNQRNQPRNQPRNPTETNGTQRKPHQRARSPPRPSQQQARLRPARMPSTATDTANPQPCAQSC